MLGIEISVRKSGDVTTLDLQGRSTIDGESELLSSKLKKIAGEGARKLLLNLADLTHVDSSGVSVIVDACVYLRRQGGDLRLVSPQGRVREVLMLFRLLEVIASFEQESQALASFGRAVWTQSPAGQVSGNDNFPGNLSR